MPNERWIWQIMSGFITQLVLLGLVDYWFEYFNNNLIYSYEQSLN